MPPSTQKRPGSNGFTLLELAVVVTVLMALAAVVVPMVHKIDDARRERARLDCGHIARALLAYMKDTRFRPTGPQGSPEILLLVSDHGDHHQNPFANLGDGSQVRPLGLITRTNTWANPRWRGPYLEVQGPDPWGHRYAAWVGSFRTGSQVWVLSAGEDGILQTGPAHATPQGDDLGVPLE